MKRFYANRSYTARRPSHDRDAAAMQATSDKLALLDARIASHGSDGLPDWLERNFIGSNATDCSALLGRVQRQNWGRDMQIRCRDALAC